MITPLLATKLFIPPVSNDSVRRFDLIARLDEGLRQGRCLTLITAPPGFGKTTLTTTWIAANAYREGQQYCWLSLEESDNDPAQFWTYFLSALQTGKAGLGEALAQSVWIQPSPPVVRSFLIGLVNEISGVDDHLVLVLDDFHLIQNEAILDGLTFLLEHHPPRFHLVLLSRTLPQLPLPRLRSRNQVTEIHQDDLRFSLAESHTFLTGQIPGISEPEEQIIHQRLEGWPAGLQLTALAIRTNPFDEDSSPLELQTGSPRKMRSRIFAQLSRAQSYLLDYLIDEVLNHQPEQIQWFLLRASILERICAPLCEAVLGKKTDPEWDYQRFLVHIEKQNLFLTSLDPERRWFRFQHLFGDLLQVRLVSQTSAQELKELHRNAAAWYQAQGFLAEAIHHALKGDQIENAVDLAERIAPEYLHNGRFNAYITLVSAFPGEALTSRPMLCLYQARALMFHGQYDSAWEQVNKIEAGMGLAIESPLLAELASLRALLATFTRSPDDAIYFAKAALNVIPVGDLVSRVRMHLILGAMHRLEARLSEAADEILEAQHLAEQAKHAYLENAALENLAALRIQAGDLLGAANLLSKGVQSGIGTGFGQVCLASIEYEWNRLEVAEAYLVEGLHLGEKSGVIDVMVNGLLSLSLLRLAQGDPKAAVDAFNQASDFSASSPGTLWGPLVAIQRRRLKLILKQNPDLSILLNEPVSYSPDDQPQARYMRLSNQVVTVREYLAAGDWQEALSLANSIEAKCVEVGLTGLLVETTLLKAIAYDASEDPPRALSVLARAIQIAEPNRYLRVFLTEGERMRRLLFQLSAQAGSNEVEQIRNLLSHFPPTSPDWCADQGKNRFELAQGPSNTEFSPSLIEPLTPREQEVLQLIAAGHTNREIADRLVMTENTVKKHTSHIFGKLSVSNRTQALITARKLGLIQS
jgi:LuxR family maltose regulon positive regulatory protein